MKHTAETSTTVSITARIAEKLIKAREYLNPRTGYSKDDIKKIAQLRALKLAKKEIVDDTTNYIEIVKFSMAQEIYGIETEHIQEVYQLKDMTLFPCMPHFVVGIINMRGKLITIIDLKKFFDLPDNEFSETSKAIIIKSGNMEFGILADKVIGIEKINPLDIQKSLPTLQGIRADYLRGVTNTCLVVLDAVKLLNDPKLLINEHV